MRLIRLFDPIDMLSGDLLSLSAGPSHHLLKVLRAKPGAPVEIFNGKGAWARGSLCDSSTKKVARVNVDTFGTTSNESNVYTTMLLGISKGDRFEYALQKATELGVNVVVPILCERSEFKLSGERLERKMDAWRKLCISACEQAYRYELPIVKAPSLLNDALAADCSEEQWVLHHRAAVAIDPTLTPKSISFVIGPEGGLSEDEISLCEQYKFHSTLFGPRVLRTETAPIVALSLIQAYYGDF